MAGHGGRGGGAAPAGGRGGRGGEARSGNTRERKQPGADLILRNLATAEEITIPEVTEYTWNQKGTHVAYTVSSNDATNDGAFVRSMSDGSVVTLHSGRGRYRSIAFDDAGAQMGMVVAEESAPRFSRDVAPLFKKKGENHADQ